MAAVKALVIAGNGTNCEQEVAWACRLAGAQADIVHLADLLAGKVDLEQYQLLNLAGGFLDGDDLGSAQAGAHRWRYARIAGGKHTFLQAVQAFIDAGKLVFGVCNGFQLLVKLGLLPGLEQHPGRQASLTWNASGRFEDRWVHLAVEANSPCVFTQGLKQLYLPVRHGEGRFVLADDGDLAALQQAGQAVLRYSDAQGSPTQEYPANPNGSLGAVAGICDASGRVFGLMPHPEAYLHQTHHPRWTREQQWLPEAGMGLWLYENAVSYLQQQANK